MKRRRVAGATETSSENPSRREFLVASASLVAATGLYCCSGGGGGSDSGRSEGGHSDRGRTDRGRSDGSGIRPRVVDLHDPKVVSGSSVVDASATAMFEAGILSLANASDLATAWKRLLPAVDSATRIGIKINARNGSLPTSITILGKLISDLVQHLGASRSNIVVWDSLAKDLAKTSSNSVNRGTAFTAASLGGGVTVKGADAGDGFTSATLTTSEGTQSIPLSNIPLSTTDITINMNLLKHHYGAGVTGAIKNLAVGCMQGSYAAGTFHKAHGVSAGANAIPRTFLPAVVDHLKDRLAHLHIIEGFFAIRDAGPDCPVTDTPGRLLMSTDPVALDAHELDVINELRAATSIGAVSPTLVDWMEGAVALGLGTRTDYDLISTTL
jgi:uncharacterized protein (DUF362 family)